jgi:hypothetical protein
MIGKPSVSAGFTKIGSPAMGVGQSEGGFSWQSYWTQRAEEWITTRSGLDLIDSISGISKASILMPTFNFGGARNIYGVKTRTQEHLFDGNDHTIYFQFFQHTDLTIVNTKLFTLGGGTVAARRGIDIYVGSNRMRIYANDGTLQVTPYLTGTGLNALTFTGEVFQCLIQIDFANKLLIASLYNSSDVAIGTPVSQDISAFTFNTNDNYGAYEYSSSVYSIENFKKFSGLKTLSQCKDNDYVTDLQFHWAVDVAGVDVSGNALNNVLVSLGVDFVVYRKIGTYPLDKGYALYRNANYTTYPFPRTISKKSNGDLNYFAYGANSGYYSAHEITGSLIKLNSTDCKIRFVNAFFDRSNATIWNDTCRAASDYDAANVKDFHIENLNQKTIYSWLNDGYRGRLIIKMTPNSIVQGEGGYAFMRDMQTLDEIILLTTDEKGSANKKALTYTGDNIGVLSAYDAEGYAQIGTLKTTKGMFTIRIDDAYDDAYENWRGVFAALGVNPTTNVHSALAGTNNGTYYWMSYDRLRTLQSEGWEICSSGMYDNDWNTSVADIDIETELATSKTQIEAENLICNHLVPNKYGIARINTRYYAKKYGFKTCHAGHTYGSVNGCNPQAIDPFNLCAMALDLTDGNTYFIDKAAPTTEINAIKAQLDLALANNAWAIMYVHLSSANLITHLTTVIQYAQSIGLTNVTLEEGLTDATYQ